MAETFHLPIALKSRIVSVVKPRVRAIANGNEQPSREPRRVFKIGPLGPCRDK